MVSNAKQAVPAPDAVQADSCSPPHTSHPRALMRPPLRLTCRPPGALQRRPWLAALLCCGLLGPAAFAQSPPPAATTLHVAAASSLAQAMPELARAFEASHPGVSVRVSLGASGALLEQLAQGLSLIHI